MVIQELETSLQDQAPQSQCDNSHLHELPLLVIDGIPTQVDKMTQVSYHSYTNFCCYFSVLCLVWYFGLVTSNWASAVPFVFTCT